MSTPVIYVAGSDSEGTLFSLSEVCERCGVHAEIIVQMVEHGIVTPIATQPSSYWQFTINALLRVRRAQRLRQDLELDLPGLALSLELLDKIESLQQEISVLKSLLQQSQEQ